MPPYPTPGTLPPATSPAGGPQPAKKFTPLQDMVDAAISGLPTGNRKVKTPPPPLTLDTPSVIDKVLSGNAKFTDLLDKWVPPSIEELTSFLNARRLSVGVQATEGGAIANIFGGSTEKDLLDDPAALERLLSSSTSGTDLAKKLQVDVNALEPLFTSSGQAKTAERDIDTQVEAMKTQLAKTQTPPLPGGSTPDSIDRMPDTGDAFALAQPTPMGSADYADLLLQLHAQDANQAPAELEAAKRKILSDQAIAVERTNQINAIYQAGVEGKPLPLDAALPTPGESTSQDRYATAGAQRASVADVIVPEGQLDTTATDEAILRAAGLVEEKRKTEAQYQLGAELTDRAQAAAAAESEIASTERAAGKAAETQARKAQEKVWDAEVKTSWANEKAATVVAGAKKDDPTAQDKFDMLRRRFSAGARTDDAITQVFDGKTSDMLTVPEMRMVQLAKVLAGGDVPPELEAEFNDVLAADRAARAEYFATGGGS